MLILLLHLSGLILALATWFFFSYKKTRITRDGKPYLVRWTIIDSSWFTIKIHKLLASDPAEMHDHPWSYMSIILWGGYKEHRKTKNYINKYMRRSNFTDAPTLITTEWYPAGSILFRPAGDMHRLELPDDVKFCTTLIFTSKKTRDWGWDTKGGWKSHKDLSY